MSKYTIEKVEMYVVCVDGIRLGVPTHKFGAETTLRRLEKDCKYCNENAFEPMMPNHNASLRCESGRHNHCTCDTCF